MKRVSIGDMVRETGVNMSAFKARGRRRRLSEISDRTVWYSDEHILQRIGPRHELWERPLNLREAS